MACRRGEPGRQQERVGCRKRHRRPAWDVRGRPSRFAGRSVSGRRPRSPGERLGHDRHAGGAVAIRRSKGRPARSGSDSVIEVLGTDDSPVREDAGRFAAAFGQEPEPKPNDFSGSAWVSAAEESPGAPRKASSRRSWNAAAAAGFRGSSKVTTCSGRKPRSTDWGDITASHQRGGNQQREARAISSAARPRRRQPAAANDRSRSRSDLGHEIGRCRP